MDEDEFRCVGVVPSDIVGIRFYNGRCGAPVPRGHGRHSTAAGGEYRPTPHAWHPDSRRHALPARQGTHTFPIPRERLADETPGWKLSVAFPNWATGSGVQ